MAAIEPAPQEQDAPFVVQDRRKKGFFIIDNDLLDYCGPILGAYGLAVYMALARFADQESECFPSQGTIAKRTGMSRMQVSREIDKLKELKLVSVEQQFGPKGEKRANLYVLLDTPHVTESYIPSNGQLQPHVTESYIPCNRELHKQNTNNKTHNNKTKNTTTTRRESDNNSSQVDDEKKDVVVALTNQGMAEGVAKRLSKRYSSERVFEKLEYLEYLQEADPSKVQAPIGWLRRAIEENYGAPDGFVSREERELLAAEAERTAQEQEERAQALESERRSREARIQAEREAAIRKQQEEYGTTNEARSFWEATQREFQYAFREDISLLLRDAWILQVEKGMVIIGVANETQWRQLQHPGTRKAVERGLAKKSGQNITLEVVLIEKRPS